MFDDFEHLLYGEVFQGLQFSVLSTPGQRCAILTVRLELQQRIVDTVKEHLIVDVLTLCQEDACI